MKYVTPVCLGETDDLDYKKIDYEYVEKIMEMNKLNSIKHLVEALTIDSKENREVKDV